MEGPKKLNCDSGSMNDITHNPMQRDCTKHSKVDKHFMKETLDGDELHLHYAMST